MLKLKAAKFLLCMACALCCTASSMAQTELKQGDRVVFFGDSITQGGVREGGYITLAAQAIDTAYPDKDITLIGAGIGGNKVSDLLKRLDRDVLEKNPDVVVIYIGINDVWWWTHPKVVARGDKGTTPEDFEAGLKSLIQQVNDAGARVILCTPTVIGEKNDGSNSMDKMLDQFAGISRRVAKETGTQLLDLRNAFISYLRKHNLENVEKGILTRDAVHLNNEGNRFLADQMLEALGVHNEDRPWADRLEYVGIAVEEPGYHVWGSSPIVDSEGKTHLFVARWPLSSTFNGWLTHSEIARYQGDRPEGPFEFQEVVVKGSGQKGDWDFGAPHNPNVQKVGKRYVLTYIANAGGNKGQRVASQRIGMMVADRLEGPWKKLGDDGLILSPPKDPSIWSYQSTVGVNNPALFEHPDGRIFLYYKAMRKGDVRRMGVAIAESLEGPYTFHEKPLTSNKTEIEDGYAFYEDGKVFLLTTHNSAGTGYLWESEDGISFREPILGYDKMASYLGDNTIQTGKVLRGKKFERPQLLLQAGHPTYLYVASGVNWNGGKGSYSCVLRVREP